MKSKLINLKFGDCIYMSENLNIRALPKFITNYLL